MFAYRSAEPAGHEEMKHRTSTGKPAAGPTAAPVMKHRDYKGETHLWTQRINRISENVPRGKKSHQERTKSHTST